MYTPPEGYPEIRSKHVEGKNKNPINTKQFYRWHLKNYIMAYSPIARQRQRKVQRDNGRY
jgi:hypothetical protein